MEDLKKLDDEIVRCAEAWWGQFHLRKPHASYSPTTNALLEAIAAKRYRLEQGEG